jgi:hypothetical protein
MSDEAETLDALLAALASSDRWRRHDAALCLQEFAEAAVEALVRQAERPENWKNNGTLIHVPRSFNCSSLFSELVRWAVHGQYEAQCHALMILDDHHFAVTPVQLRDAERTLGELRTREDMEASDAEQLHRELVDILSSVETIQEDPG